MKKGDKKAIEYYSGLNYKTSPPSNLLVVSTKGIVSIVSNPLDVTRIYVNILNSLGTIIKTIPIDVLPLNEPHDSYVSIYVG